MFPPRTSAERVVRGDRRSEWAALTASLVVIESGVGRTLLALVFLSGWAAERASAQLAVPDAPPVVEGRPDPKPLRFAFLTGKTYRFVVETSVRAQIPGRGIRELSVKQQARIESRARAGGKAGTSLRCRTEHLGVEIRTGDTQLKYDSLDPSHKETRMGKHFRAALDRWIDVELNRDYRVVSSQIGERANLTALAEPIEGFPVFGAVELEQLVATLGQGLPPGSVAPGEVWQIEGSRTIEGAGEVAFGLACRYEGMVRHEGVDCDAIVLNGRLSGEPEVPGAAGPAKGSFRDATLRGRILLDPEARTVRFSEQEMSLLLEFSAPDGGLVQVPIEQAVAIRLLHVIDSPGE